MGNPKKLSFGFIQHYATNETFVDLTKEGVQEQMDAWVISNWDSTKEMPEDPMDRWDAFFDPLGPDAQYFIREIEFTQGQVLGMVWYLLEGSGFNE